MDVNDPLILETINRLIASDRLNKNQILHIVNLASISNSFKELKDYLEWETSRSKYKKITKNL